MEPIDLKTLALRESDQVEWKENVADTDNVVATLSAFAMIGPTSGGATSYAERKKKKMNMASRASR